MGTKSGHRSGASQHRSNENDGRGGEDKNVSKGNDEGGDKPAPSKLPQPTVVLHHFYNPDTRDHRYLTDYDAGAQIDGYEWRGETGKVFNEHHSGTTGFSGEEGFIGFIWSSPGPNNTALYYCISGYGDFFTTSAAEADRAQSQASDCRGVVGYIGV
jgi:hypothetical protein